MGIIADLMVRVGADVSAARAGLQQVGTDVEQQTGKVNKVMAAWSVAGAAITTATGFMAENAQMANEDAANQAKLEQAVRNSGVSYESVQGAIEARIAANQDLAFSDDQTRDSLALLVAQTGSVDEAMRRQALAMDLARGTGMDLVSASKLLGKVTDENVNVLNRYGIHVEKGADQTALFAAVQQKFGGQAVTYANTTSGSIDRLRDKISEWRESMGAALGPATGVVSLLPGMSSGFSIAGATLGPLIGWIRSFSATAALAAVRGAAVRAATLAWTGVQWLLNIALSANPIGLVVIAIAALVGGFILAYKNIGPFRDFVNSLWGTLRGFAGWVQANFLNILREMVTLIASLATFNISGVTSSLHALHVPGFDYGGIVPGDYLGQPRLVMARAGEQYLGFNGIGPTQTAGGGPLTVQVYAQTNADPFQIAGEVGWELLKLRRKR